MKNSESNPDSEASGCRAVIEISISNPTVKLQDKLQGLQEITALQPPPFRRLLASTNAASLPTQPGRSSKASTPTMMTRSPSNNVLTTLELKVRTLHHHLCSSPLLPISSKQQRQAATTSSNGDGKVSDIKVLCLPVLTSIDEARCLQLQLRPLQQTVHLLGTPNQQQHRRLFFAQQLQVRGPPGALPRLLSYIRATASPTNSSFSKASAASGSAAATTFLMVRHASFGILATTSPSLRSPTALTLIPIPPAVAPSSRSSRASMHSIPSYFIHRLNVLTRLLRLLLLRLCAGSSGHPPHGISPSHHLFLYKAHQHLGSSLGNGMSSSSQENSNGSAMVV
ncbi:hypothetical protein ACFX2J_046099 [Malus domestica]